MAQRYFAGLDVHKKTIVIAVIDDNCRPVERVTIKADRAELASWLGRWRRKSMRIALEASGSSAWVTYFLLDAERDVTPVHPNHVRAIAETKRKSDRLDAMKLAELLKAGVLRPVHVPSFEERATRALVRQVQRLVKTKTRAKNAVTSLLAEHGYAAPVADPFGKRGRIWLASLPLRDEYRLIVDQQLAQIALLTEQLAVLDKRLTAAVAGNPFHELVRTIPGVATRLAPAIVLETGDIRRFKTGKAAACYSGTIPATYQSGEKERGGGITKEGNPILRWALVQAVMQLIRLDPGAKARYTKLRNRLKKHKARIAMARRLMVTLWHMAKTGEAYRREDPPPKKPKKRCTCAAAPK